MYLIVRTSAMLLVGALLGYAIEGAVPAHAGTDEFLSDLNNVGIGNRDDTHNFDLVGFGNVICWRLNEGAATSQVATESGAFCCSQVL